MISWPISGHIVFLPWCCFKELHEKQQWGTWLVLSLKYIKACHLQNAPPSPRLVSFTSVQTIRPTFCFYLPLKCTNTASSIKCCPFSTNCISLYLSVRSSSEGAVGDTNTNTSLKVVDTNLEENISFCHNFLLMMPLVLQYVFGV